MPASNFGTRLAGGLQDIIPLLMSLQQRQDMLGQQSIENKRAKTQEERAKEIFQLEKDVAQTNRLRQMYENMKPPEPPKPPTGKMGELKYLIEELGLPKDEALNRIYPPRPERTGTTAKPKEPKPGKTPQDYRMQLLMERLGQTRKTDILGESRTEPIGLPEAAASADSLMNLLQFGQFTRPPEPTFGGAPKYSPAQAAPAQNQVIPGLTPEETAEYYQLMREIGGGR
jgi:hypothetical protein